MTFMTPLKCRMDDNTATSKHAPKVNVAVTEEFTEQYEEVAPNFVLIEVPTPTAPSPLDVTVFTRKGCSHCARAKQALASNAVTLASKTSVGIGYSTSVRIGVKTSVGSRRVSELCLYLSIEGH